MTRKRLLAVSLMAGLVLWAPSALQASDLESISFTKEGPAVTVVVRVRGNFGNEAFTLREPERLVIDVSPVEGISAPPQIEIAAGGVLRVRTGRFQADVARLVFDLEGPGILYRIERTAEGLRITFWREGESALKPDVKPAAAEPPPAPPAAEPERKVEPPAAPVAAPETRPAEPSAATATPVAASEEPEKGFFVLLGGGVGTFLNSESTFTRSFPVNVRQGTAESTYKPKLNTPAVLSFGRYLRLQEMSIKFGFDIEYWNFKSDGAHVFKIPHPFLADTDRTLEATNSFRSYFTAVSAFGLVRVFTNGALTVAAGPELGYVFGKYKFLDVIDIADAAPYTEAEVSIRELTYADKTASSLLAGLRVGFEYALSSKLALVLDLKVQYASPEIGELSNKIGLSQGGAVIGIQYNF
jgi:hypothetical protein